MILQEIRSIIDLQEFHQLIHFVATLKRNVTYNTFILDCYLQRLNFEKAIEKDLDNLRESYIQSIENKFRVLAQNRRL
jgi:DNA (cytosine-5)-methyltransferase 1